MIRQLFKFILTYKWTSLTLILVFSFLSLLPNLVQQLLLNQLQQHGADHAQIDNVDINLFRGEFAIQGLHTQLNSPSGQQDLLKLDTLAASWNWSPLLHGQIEVDNVTIENVFIHAQHQQNNLIIGGFTIPLTSDNSQQEHSELPPVAVNQVQFKAIQLDWHTPEQAIQKTEYHLDSLELNQLHLDGSQPSELIIYSHLNQAKLNGHFWLSLFQPQPSIVGTIKTQQLTLQELPYLAELSPAQLAASINSEFTFTADLLSGGIRLEQQGKIELNQWKFQQDSIQTGAQQIVWDGDVLLLQSGTQPELSLNGEFSTKRLDVSADALSAKTDFKTQLNLNLTLTENGLTLKQSGPVTVRNLFLQQAEQRLNLDQMQWQGNLQLNSAEATQITTLGSLKLDGVEVQTPEMELAHNLNAKLDAEIHVDEQGLTLVQEGNLTISQLRALQAKQQITLKNLDWSGLFNLQNQEQLAIQSKGKVNLSELDVRQNQAPLLNLDQFNIQQLEIKALDNIKASDIELQQLLLVADKDLPLHQLKRLHINQAWLPSYSRLIVGDMLLQGGETQLNLTAENQIEQINRLQQRFASADRPTAETASTTKPEVTETASAETTEQTTDKTNQPPLPIDLQLQSIRWQDGHQLVLLADHLEPKLNKQIQLKTLEVGQLNTQQPQTDTPLTLHVVIDEFSELKTSGNIQPFNPDLALQLVTSVQGVELLDFSPLAERQIGYNIESGQVNAELDTQISDNKIKAENTLKLHKLQLVSAKNQQTEDFEQGLNMPINAALALLRDKQDNIKLDLPIEGQLDDPDFNLDSIINTALAGAMKKGAQGYLLFALQPFGAIAMLGEMALDSAGAIQLQAIDFKPGQDTLSDEMHTYLGKLHTLLQERQGIQIKVCGLANQQDRAYLLGQKKSPSQSTDKQGQGAANKTKTPPSIDEILLTLAKSRGDAIKRSLLKLGTTTSQVVLCQPKLSDDNESPKVALGI